MGVRNYLLGAAGIVKMVWDQGEAKQTSMEGEDCIMLDSGTYGWGGRVCDVGLQRALCPADQQNQSMYQRLGDTNSKSSYLCGLSTS